MSKRYVAYLRVSTNRQGHSGLGLDAQREAIGRYVGQVAGQLIGEEVEVESGRASDRPGLHKALAVCRESSSCLVIAKLDRLARNVAFVSSLMEGGVEFVAVDAPYANRLMLHILAAFAEHEREAISERTKAALAAAKARGVKLGVNGQRLAVARRQEALVYAEAFRPLIMQARSEGASTYAELAAWLNDRGMSTRFGQNWSAGTVHRLTKRLAASCTGREIQHSMAEPQAPPDFHMAELD